MSSLRSSARKVGLLYLVFAIVAIFNEFYISAGFVVAGDPTTTAANIAVREHIFRLGILSSFINLILFAFLVVGLYKLFKDIDAGHALLMVIFVTLGIAVSLVNLVMKTAPLMHISETAYLPAFTKVQQDTLAFSFLRLRGSGANIAMAFWGLWLFPFGMLVIRSRFIPKILGFLLLVAGFAYVTSSFTSIILPEHRQAISKFLMPLYFGEIPIIFWLVIKGAKESATQPEHKDVVR